MDATRRLYLVALVRLILGIRTLIRTRRTRKLRRHVLRWKLICSTRKVITYGVVMDVGRHLVVDVMTGITFACLPFTLTKMVAVINYLNHCRKYLTRTVVLPAVTTPWSLRKVWQKHFYKILFSLLATWKLSWLN